MVLLHSYLPLITAQLALAVSTQDIADVAQSDVDVAAWDVSASSAL
jgi:hypothetical protein